MDEVEVEPVEVKITRHRKKDPQNCARCATHRQIVAAEWNVKIGDGRSTPMCDTHARYWTGKHGLMEFPGDR